ncbi:DUF2190 family protein [Vibrio sp. 1636]|uniref:DUF2190 family protein n=1 Tax=Vibrio alginolyticus TaxID=663 RepID=A0A7Y0R1L4_VIBAL|nr:MULTISPECIES: capsid cement protein [Vibrio]MDW2204319.1 DUF2190 family protein [Vibrio sp. 1636]NMR76254.1 DUF2190 family protein [Vibrio alginolyticus]
MAKNYIHDGATIEFTAVADVKSGDVVAVSSVVVVAINDVASGDKGLGHTCGVWDLPKAEGTTFNQGVSVYLKDGEIGVDNTGVYAGKAWSAGVNGETVATVKLDTKAD